MFKKSFLRPLIQNPITWAFFASLVYWSYLYCTTNMTIIFDSVSYESLGHMIATKGWVAFFQEGPQREPVYPFLVAISVNLAKNLSLSYQSILVPIQLFILFLTQYLTYKLLKDLLISPKIIALTILYIGISPGLVNSALSLYSEIATYPFILLIILCCKDSWYSIRQGEAKNASFIAITLASSLLLITLTKAAFEIITPLLLIPFIAVLIKHYVQKNGKLFKTSLYFLLIVLSIFYSGLFGYKFINKIYNGQFVLTNRGSWALYGNTARRMEADSIKHLFVALAYMPGEGVCRKIYNDHECDFWSYKKSDNLGYNMNTQLQYEGYSGRKLDAQLIKLSKNEVFKNPFQYSLYFGIEGMKMLFWDSTRIGFVTYPHWLSKIFNFTPFKNSLRLVIFFLTFYSLVWSLGTFKWHQQSTLLFCLLLIAAYIGVHSFFFTITRYSFPIAPLFLIVIANTIHFHNKSR